MSIHCLERTQVIRASPEAAWKFFSSPNNLKVITPPSLDFQVKSKVTEEIYEGLVIAYRVRPLWGIPVTWMTEITHVRAPFYFCDEQRVGPYRVWHHEHFFTPQPDGTVLARDVVHYVLPFSPWSDLVHSWLVLPRLEEIFAFRQQKLAELFP